MSNASVVGALRVVLGLDSAAFEGGLNKAQRHLKRTGAEMQATGASIATAGAAMTAAFTTGFAALGFHLLQGSQDAAAAAAQVNAALASMGDASGKTFTQLQRTAESLRDLTGVDDDLILEKVTANLLTFGNVAGEVFDRAQAAALDLSARLKTDLQSATLMIGKALNDPVRGLTALRRTGIQFTEAQEEMIKSMVAANDVAGAQGIMLAELERQFGGAAEAAGNADIWMPLKTALMDLEGAFEPLVRDAIAPLIKQVADLTRAFAAVSPETQKLVVAGAAIAAALGPALIAIGGVVSAVGTLTAALGSGGALAGIGAALAPLAPLILPIAAAIGVAVAAFLLFKDDVMPVLSELWSVAQKTLGPAFSELFSAVGDLVKSIGGVFKVAFESEIGQALVKFQMAYMSVLGQALIHVLTTIVRTVATVVRAISDGFKVLGALLKGDFAGAWEAYREGSARALEGLKNAFSGLASFAIEQISRMVEGVGRWLTGRLFDVLRGVIGRVREVSDAFFKLYDAVVGNSYIPDLVEGIAEWMAKLDAGMVQPARNATEAARREFETLRDDVAAIFDRMLTDTERATLKLSRELASIGRSLSLGQITTDQARQAENFLYMEGMRPLPGLEPVAATRIQAPDIFPLGAVNEAADDFAYAFGRSMERVLRGDVRGVFEDLMADMARAGFEELGRSLFKGGGEGSGGFGGLGNLFKSALSWLPGFQHGGSILPGGHGGIDSQLVAFWKSPSEQVDIYTPGNDAGPAGGGMEVFVRPSPYFDVEVRRVAQPIADGAYSRAMTDAPKVTMAQTAKQQRHAVGRRSR